MYYKMNDPEIDMEELEARLYGQVHHGANEDDELPNFKPPMNTLQTEPSAKRFGRYFEDKKSQPAYNNANAQRPFQNAPMHNNAYLRPNPNLFNSSENFFTSRVGLFSLPELVLNPPVNNIVVLPPTQIFTQPEPWQWSKTVQQYLIDDLQKSPERKRFHDRVEKFQRKKKERNARRAKKRLLAKAMKQKEMEQHQLYLHHLPVDTGAEDAQGNLVLGPEIICLSESDNSDCEAVEKDYTVLVLSSDDEKAAEEPPVIKYESVQVHKNNDEKSEAEGQNDCHNKIEETKAAAEPECLGDDDVIYVEPPERGEVITIDWDDSQMADASTASTSNSQIGHNIISSQELLETPESVASNDFLDSTLNLLQQNEDSTISNPGQCPDTCETESSCSTNDFEAPSRSAIFSEEAFDSHNKELNLDSFTDYIATRAAPSTSIPSILTPLRKPAPRSKNKSKSSTNSSDSSSESDYDDSKAAHVENGKRTRSQKKKSSQSSQSDEGIIDNSPNKALPNLSPITSDEEMNVTEIKSSKPKNVKKPKKSPEAAYNTPEKRKIEKDDIDDQNKRKKLGTPSSSKNSQEVSYSISDEEVDIVPQIELDSSGCSGDSRELLNIETTSTPINVPQRNNAKPKRFLDYWTENMHKFYFKTWGGENFSVPEAQRSMSDNPALWKIISRDQANINLSPKGPRCRRCREFGHKAIHCTKKLGPLKCILCGARGHLEERCPNKVCTSCGRRSHYSTTYCSRCANTRYAQCRICSMRGHTSSSCSDLWRRYHLTTKEGPVRRSSNAYIKAPRDRWCSGCASRGHFEHDCNYYNRTHPPTNPSINTYQNIYENSRDSYGSHQQRYSTRETRSDNGSSYVQSYAELASIPPFSNKYEPPTQAQASYRNYPNNVGPLMSIPINSNAMIYPYSHSGSPNYYQQFPVYNSVLGTLPMQQSLGNNRIVELSGIEVQHEADSVSTMSSIELTAKKAVKLLDESGVNFLRALSYHTNLEIKMQKRHTEEAASYLCTLKGPDKQKQEAKDTIARYLDPWMLQGKLRVMFHTSLNMQLVKEDIENLQDPDKQWFHLAKSSYASVKRCEKQLKHMSQKIVKKARKKLKQQLSTLNAVILGKLKVADGPKHIRVLKQWVKQGNETAVSKAVQQSFKYVFKNDCRLSLNYPNMIHKISNTKNVHMLEELHKMLNSGISMCQNQKWTSALRDHNDLYGLMVINNYNSKSVEEFKKHFAAMKSEYKNGRKKS